MSNEITTMEAIIEENTDKMIAAFTKEGGMDYLLQDVDEAVDCFQHDMSTKTSRGRTATLANKVVKVKSKVDSVRKELTATRREEIKRIDGFGKIARDHLAETKIRARQPLTDWEEEEQKRVDELEKKIIAIAALGETTDPVTGAPLDLDTMKENLQALDAVEVTEEAFGDKELDAFKVKKFGSGLVANAIAREEGRIAQEEELKILRAAEAKRVTDELAEKRIAKEKEEAAERKIKRKEAEEARKEKQAAHDKRITDDAKREAQEARDKAESDAKKAKEAAKQAKEAAKQAEIDRKEQAKRAAADKIQADKDHKAEIKKAKEEAAAESLRQQQQVRDKLQREKEEREANEQLVKDVKMGAASALVTHASLMPGEADLVIKAISERLIPNVRITF